MIRLEAGEENRANRMIHCHVLKSVASWGDRKLPSKQSITVRCMTMKDYPSRKMVYCIGGVSSLEAVSWVRRYLKYYKVVDTELGPKQNKSKEERYEGENVKTYGI